MQRLGFPGILLAGAALACAPLTAQTAAPAGPLAQQIHALVNEPGVARAHWGVAVTNLDGKLLFGLNEGQLFQPASNNKLFTTATALALLGSETTYTTKIAGRGVFTGNSQLKGDLVIVGAGDANLSGRAIPYLQPKDRPKRAPGDTGPAPLRYLAEMADSVAASGLKLVEGDIVGDDTLFPWEPYAADWSIEDALWGYGAPVSALTINDNQIAITVHPAATAGDPPAITVLPAAPAYYTIDARGLTTTAAKTGSHVDMSRAIGSRILRIYGTIATDAPADDEEVAIEDPAEYAAIAFKGMLESRGIRVTGVARPAHLLPTDAAGFFTAATKAAETYAPKGVERTEVSCNIERTFPAVLGYTEKTLAEHKSVPLAEDLVVTNKVSQNLHAELFLHQLGLEEVCSGATSAGAGVIRGFMTTRVGIDPDDFLFYDGSGLSGHDLVTPRAIAKLLVYATGEAWFPGWKRSLPVGGEDGTLIARFPKAPLKDNLFAKTGTLSEARALSGYLVGASGKTVIFSVMVNNHTPRNTADRETMDRIVAAIAAAK